MFSLDLRSYDPISTFIYIICFRFNNSQYYYLMSGSWLTKFCKTVRYILFTPGYWSHNAVWQEQLDSQQYPSLKLALKVSTLILNHYKISHGTLIITLFWFSLMEIPRSTTAVASTTRSLIVPHYGVTHYVLTLA